MIFENLVEGKLLKRYKRFLVDVELKNGEIVIAHTSNTGAMLSCIEELAPVLLSVSNNPKRKTKYTWEMIYINGSWVGINTAIPNIQAEIWMNQHFFPTIFPDYSIVKREYKFLESRIDLYCENDQEKCLIELKNVTYRQNNRALFPDAKSIRAQKHLHTLMNAKQKGYRAVMMYFIQRSDVDIFAAADKIDPTYAHLLDKAFMAGVEIIPVRVKVSPNEIKFDKILPFQLYNSNEK